MANYLADTSRGGVNPYHFVRLGSGVTREKLPYSAYIGPLTGVIRCSLRTTRPLCIPDFPNAVMKMTDDGKRQMKHKEVPFFRVNGEPVIPGSELRGVVRSAYEALSNSCLSVNNNNDLTARSTAVRKPGLLRYDTSDRQWHLYEASAKKTGYNGDGSFDETPDTFMREWLNYRYIKGKPQRFEGKVPVTYKFMSSFVPVEADNLEDAVKDYGIVCKIYKDNNGGAIKDYIRLPRRDNKYYPVYYLLTTDETGRRLVYLSPAQLSRSVFHNRLSDLVGTYSKCTCSDTLCPACRMFGMIADRKSQPRDLPAAVASRVRFSDAACTEPSALKYYTLKELSSPKLSAVEFYSTAPDMSVLWTYDTKGVKVNGRKFYFHHSSDFTSAQHTQRNITAELMETGAVFTFSVYFEHLTQKELEQLVWTLAIGENDLSGKQQHKLGHGRPLGLGSVKIRVDAVTTRQFDTDTLSYTETDADVASFFQNDVPDGFDMDADYFRDFMHMTDFGFLEGKHVQYPYGDNGKGRETSTGTLAWFQGNHNDGRTVNPGEDCTVRFALPRLTDDLVLPALIASGERGAPGQQRSGNGGKARKPAYSGPMSFESKSAPIEQFEEVHCKTKKCKGVMKAKKTPGFMKTEQTLVCPICKKALKGKW